MKPLRTPPSALLTLLLAALALPCAALPIGLRLAARAAAAGAQSRAETPEERAYRIYAPCSAFEVTVTNGTTFVITLYRLSGHASFTIDWGDGTVSTYSSNGNVSHTYAADGAFVVKISDDVNCFIIDGWNGDIRSRAFVTAALRWGDNITSAQIYNGFGYCYNLTGFVPRWPPNMTDAQTAFALTGVTGEIPAWPDGVTNARSTYSGCAGLTGEIPAWPDGVTDARGTYNCCAGLTGSIPEWGAAMTVVSYCYNKCSGLTGAWTDDPAELMPTNITTHYRTVAGTANALSALFYSDWGGTREKPATE